MSNEYDISRAFKRIENDLIDSMMRNMKRHQVEEADLGFEWEQWQALQLQELEEYRKKNAQLFSGDFKEINDKIEDLFKQTCKDAQAKEENALLDRIRKKQFTPPIDKGSFFTLNEGKLSALIMATKADFFRAEYSMLTQSYWRYRQIIFDSMTYANVTNDYKKAVDMATKDFLRSGINCIEYKNGAKHTVPDYARMALRTGNKRAYLMGEGNAHDRYGLHTVRVNKRPHACPKCVGFLGRLLIDDVYGGGSRAEATAMGIPTLSDAIGAGFLHPNCKDMYSVYIPEVSKPATPWTEEEISDIVGEYNQEQEIRHAEDMRDTYQRMAKYSLDPENQATYQQRADNWQARVDELSDEPPQPAPQPVIPTIPQPIAPVEPTPETDRVTVLRDMIAEAEAESKQAQDLVDTWVSDTDYYENHKAWAQIIGEDFDEYLESELKKAEEDFANEPHDINKRSLEKMKRIIANRKDIEEGKKLKQYRAEAKKKAEEVERLKAELDAELDKIDKAKQTTAFDLDSVEWTAQGEDIRKKMDLRGVEYRGVSLLDKELTEEEIIEKLAGGDQTRGSCMSLAQAYTANKCGLDVIDYRGGESQYVMSISAKQIMHLKNITPIAEPGEKIRPAKRILAKVEEGKEYYFITGCHASIVRKKDGVLEYLELQSAVENGWKPFEKDVILWKGTPMEETKHRTVSDTLKDRFGCDRGSNYGYSYLVDIEQFRDNDEFRGLMGYINTAEHRQKKGASGSVK